jgi:hypothetical protein
MKTFVNFVVEFYHKAHKGKTKVYGKNRVRIDPMNLFSVSGKAYAVMRLSSCDIIDLFHNPFMLFLR